MLTFSNRDVENANPGLEQIFDKEKEQNRLKAAQLIAEIGSQALDIARTEGQIAGEKAKRDPAALAAAKAELAGKGKLNPTADEIAKQAYDTAMKPFGTGSALQQGLQAATAAIQGLAGGSVAQAVSGAAAPYLAEVIHDMTTTKGPDGKEVVNREANLMAHAVVGAVTAYAAGNSALAGASGAAMGEFIAQQLYPDIKREDLTEEQRQTISALGTLAAGLAGGVAGDSTADAVAGAQAGKTSLENNTLAVPVMPPPVAGTNTGEAVSDANKTMASALDKAVKDIVESIDKATECSFGRACSSDSTEEQNQPNVGKELTDAEKAELGGSGAGTPGGWEPQDEENERNNENSQINNFDRFNKDDLLSSANKPINEQGLSAAARAWEKHAGRPGGVFEPLKGNHVQKNETANKFINEVLNNTNTVKTDLSRGGVEYRLPDGRGIRYNSDGSFSGLLDPKKPR